jgi:hypothetical protein
VSGGNLGTHLDRPYAQQPDTRAAATRYLERTGHADLLDVLGLGPEPDGPSVIDGRECCPSCGKPLPDPVSNGGRKPCRRRACVNGDKP